MCPQDIEYFRKKDGKNLVLPVFCVLSLYHTSYYSLIQNNKNGEFVNAAFKLYFLLNRDISIRHHQHHTDNIKEEKNMISYGIFQHTFLIIAIRITGFNVKPKNSNC